MKAGTVLILILGLLGVLALPPHVIAGNEKEYTLEFKPTQNAPVEAEGTMTLKVVNGETVVHFRVRGAYPDTVYTIWIVFNLLQEPLPTEGHAVPAISASTRPGFPAEGNGVSPLARLDDGFTSGMGMDPGASFVTNSKGDGEVQVKLDYDLVREAPVSNKDVIFQCIPVQGITFAPDGKATCIDPDSTPLRVTTTWLRVFIGQIPASDRATMCANYDPKFDPSSPEHDPIVSKGQNALLWQCINPATVDPKTGNGLPMVHRYEFNHFRLANHPDDLTHGFIGGNGTDHWIDMVGRRCDLMPSVGAVCPSPLP